MSPRPSEPRARPWQTGPWPAVVVGLVCFLNTLPNQFVYDDKTIIVDNPRIRSLTNLHGIWLSDWWQPQDENLQLPNPARDRLYRPLTMYSFALNYALGGLNPLGYRLANIALHALACGLTWELARRFTGKRAVAALAAILFAVHPVHCEPIAMVVGRAELLATLFLQLSLLALLPASEKVGVARLGAAAVASLAAVLAKETAVSYLAVALLGLHAVHRANLPPLRWWVWRAGLLAVPILIYLPLRYTALGGNLLRDRPPSEIANPLLHASLTEQVSGALTILGHYLRLMVAPADLSSDYGLAVIDPAGGPDAQTVLGAVAAGGLALALAGYRRRSGLWAQLAPLAAIWLASYALISNTALKIGTLLGERLMYWPSLWALLIAALALVRGWEVLVQPGRPLYERARLLRILGVVLVVGLALRSVVRNTDWKSDYHIFGRDVRTWPRSAHLNACFARVLLDRADRQSGHARRSLIRQADAHLRTALTIYPRFSDALQLRGYGAHLLGDQAAALRLFEAALTIQPTDQISRSWVTALRQRADASKLPPLERAVAERPDDPAARAALGRTLLEIGRPLDARPHLEHAWQATPDDSALGRALAEACTLSGDDTRAIEIYRQLVTRDASDWESRSNLAVLISHSAPAEALRYAREAHALRPDDFRTHVNLAEALILCGEKAEARRILEAVARGLPPDDPMQAIVQQRLEQLAREGP